MVLPHAIIRDIIARARARRRARGTPFEETGPLDLILTPCGGGGLLSGTALSAEILSPGCRVVGVEPRGGR